MKAAILSGPGNLQITEVHDPEIGHYDALCALLYGAVCTGTDSHILDGTFPYSNPYPTIPGHESVGRVIRTGPGVRHFRVGDIVTRVGAPDSPSGAYTSTWGGYATLGIAVDHWAMVADGVALPPGDFQIRTRHLVPGDIELRHSPMIITWRETLSYVTRMGLGEGASVLVIGSGGNGLSMANHAANLGAARVGMIGSPAMAERARAVGVTHYADYSDPAAVDAMKNDAGGYDFVIDAVGQDGNLDTGLSMLKAGGTIGLYGLDEVGSCRMTAPGKPFRFFPSNYDEAETHYEVLRYMREGKLRASDYLANLDSPYSLDNLSAAFADLASRRIGPKALIELAEE